MLRVDAGALRIGDIITLQNLPLSSYLSAEGILLDDIYVSEDLSKFEDNLFQVHLQRQYSAAKEYDNFLREYQLDENSEVEEIHLKKYMEALKRGRDNEKKLNDGYLKNKTGINVVFGDVIQLFHVKSMKYLKVLNGKLAKDERENMRIALDSHGDSSSWIQLLPRYKIHREGDNIQTKLEVILSVADRKNEFIHCADRKPQPGYPREVNCSLDISSWSLVIFESSLDAADNKFLLASQLVSLYDPETLTNISIVDKSGESIEEFPIEMMDVFAHDYGDLIGRPVVGDKIDSSTLWQLESKQLVTGGLIQWKTDSIRLRHLNSNLYLVMSTREEFDHENSSTKEIPCFSITEDASLPGTLFNINELNSTSNFLQDSKPIQISQKGTWLQRGVARDDGTFEIKGTSNKPAALNLIINRYVERSMTRDEDDKGDGEESHAKRSEPLDVHVGIAARSYLDKYFHTISIPPSFIGHSIWQDGDSSTLEFFLAIVTRAINFSQGFSIFAENVNLEVDKVHPILRTKRQNLLREQGFLLIVLRMIDKLKPIADRAELQERGDMNMAEQILVGIGIDVIAICFKLVYYCILDNPSNQYYVAEYMVILLGHLPTQPLAGKTVTEMLNKNMEIQEDKMSDKEFEIFVEKLKGSNMNAMYLQLLRSCCSCQGNGVDGNQCRVADVLFDRNGDILLKISQDFKNSVHHDWHESGLYIPLIPKEELRVFGDRLIVEGIPEIFIQWDFSHLPNYSMQKIFGKSDQVDVVNLLCKNLLVASHNATKGISKKAGSEDRRKVVYDYLVAQMLLSAEMCMDRNYVGISKLDDMFTYELLVAILIHDLPAGLKAASLRMLLCQHVDRDPQAMIKIPRLTRGWKDTSSNADPQLPYLPMEHQCKFALLQQIISEYIQKMANAKWDEMSENIMNLLLTLITFRFYGTNERLQDVIFPLIVAIDRRKVDNDLEAKQLANTQRKKNASLKKERAQNSNKVAVTDPNAAELEEEEEAFEEDEELEETWQERCLTFLESLPVILFVLGVVTAVVACTIYEVIENIDNPNSPIYQFAVATFIFFIVEIGLRAYCFKETKGSYLQFVLNIYNAMDIVVILLDLIFLIVSPAGNSTALTKSIRMIRFIKLVRVLRFARVGNRLKEIAMEGRKWKMPLRYSKAPPLELKTLEASVNILSYIQKIVDDRNLSILLRMFYKVENGSLSDSAAKILEDSVDQFKSLSIVIAPDFNLILIDLLMFVHPPLVQATLDVILSSYSSLDTVVKNISSVQLMISPRREEQFDIVQEMLSELEQLAETHELWGELESDEDLEKSNKMKSIMVSLTNICRTVRTVLEFDELYQPDVEIQKLYLNLNCFEICLKVLQLIDSVEEGEGEEEVQEVEEEEGRVNVSKNTLELCRLCNGLLYWFLLGNADTQELAYNELDFFINSLDRDINSHHVLKAIFYQNEKLMKSLNHNILNELSDKIIKIGKFPYFLSLFVHITNVGEKNMVENQFEIMKCLTSPGRIEKIGLYFVDTNHLSYNEKREMMIEYLDGDPDISMDDLPSNLHYHLLLVQVMAGCTVGRLNITTIETKVQSVFNYVHVINSLLDPATILIAKIKLSSFLFNAIIEVEMKIPGLEQTAGIWKLLESYGSILNFARDDLRLVEKLGWDSHLVKRRKIEYMVYCVMIIGGFFSRYYDPNKFYIETPSPEKTEMTINQINDLVNFLYSKIKDVYELDSPRLSTVQKGYFYDALVALNRSSTKLISTNIPKIHIKVAKAEKSHVGKDSDEHRIMTKFTEFVSELKSSDEVKKLIDNESQGFISCIESLPFIDDLVVSDVRYEALIKKLVSHINDSTTVTYKEKSMEPRCVKTSIWVLKAFRTMIENKMGMTIFERDDDGGAEQDEASWPTVNALNNCGVTNLCLHLVAVGIDENLQTEAIKLLIGMLFKEGGAKEVQGAINKHLSSHSDLFFKQIRIILNKLIAWHGWHGVTKLEEGQDPVEVLPGDFMILRFMQLMSEGHYLPNQDITRDQPHNLLSINLLDDLVNYLNCLSRIPCRTSTVAGIRVAAVILEVIQGPCVGNQLHLTLNTELLETLNRLVRSKAHPLSDCLEEEEVEFKMVGIDILQGLLEGQGEKSPIYERILSVLHIDIIKMIALPDEGVEEVVEENKTNNEEENPEVEEKAEDPDLHLSLQVECMVLLQMLCDFRPSLRTELDINIPPEQQSQIASVEVMWNGTLQRRYFHIPDLCSILGKQSKDELVENIDRSNHERKVLDFLRRSRGLYMEVKHRERLQAYGMNEFTSAKNFGIATQLMLIVVVLINIIFLKYYKRTNIYDSWSSTTYIDGYYATNGIYGLNVLLCIIAAYALISYVLVSCPVSYQKLQNAGYKGISLIFYTATEGLTIYYCWFLAFALLGLNYNYYFLPFLLLDIAVQNSTVKIVLNAVYKPRKQLSIALLLGIFVIYLYTYYIFHFYRSETQTGEECNTLWDCCKFVFVYGLLAGGGITDVMLHRVTIRFLLDLTFFLAVTIALLNIIFGIIIDTFSEMRAAKEEILRDTFGTCLICGIEGVIFDRASDTGNGFKQHIKVDHHMWNYLYFIFFIWEQDKDDDDGLELYIRQAVENNDISWFPINKAMKLNLAKSKSEVLREQIKTSISERRDELENKFNQLQQDIGLTVGIIRSAMKSAADVPAHAVKLEIASKLKVLLNRSSVVEKTEDVDDDNKSTFSLETKNSAFSIDENSKKVYATKLNIIRTNGDNSNDIENLSIRLIIGDVIQSISCKQVKDNVAMFNSVLICENVLPEDSRTLTIQVLQQGEGGVSKFIGNIDLQLVDIYDDDTIVEKEFVRQDLNDKRLTIELEFGQIN